MNFSDEERGLLTRGLLTLRNDDQRAIAACRRKIEDPARADHGYQQAQMDKHTTRLGRVQALIYRLRHERG